MQLTFLGTAGSWPTRDRSASAIALDLEEEIVLLDCGEGTQRQFFRSPVSFMRVRRVLLTHFHGDHVLGLPGLIQTMGLNQRTEPLDVYGPRDTRRFVEMMTHLGYSEPRFPVLAHELEGGETLDAGTYTISCAAATHTIPALAFRVEEREKRGRFDGARARALGVRGPEFRALEEGRTVTTRTGETVRPETVMGPPRSGRSVVYTGDTRPTPAIVQLAQGADVLVHEATFADGLQAMAEEWGHSTAAEAAAVAKEAQVGELFLTHFSARYPETAPLEEEARTVFPSTRAAEDLLTHLLRQR